MENHERDDLELVKTFLRKRDENSFRALYQRHSPALFALAMRLLGGVRADAEDVVQETWLRAAKALADFAWRSSLRTWLCGIVINCSRAIQTHKANPTNVNMQLISAESHKMNDLEQLIYQLPNGYREVFVLHDIEGYTHLEISKQLGIAEGTSKSQLSGARKWLRTKLQSANSGEGGSYGR